MMQKQGIKHALQKKKKTLNYSTREKNYLV